MAARVSRSHDPDKPQQLSSSSSQSKSRSRSRHKRQKHKLRITEHDTTDGNHISKTEKNEQIIASYEPSADIKNELRQLLQKEHHEYMKNKKEAHNKISTILNSMTTKQEQRYECWNRSVIPKNVVKSIMNNVLNRNSSNTSRKKSNIDDKSVIVMQTLSKCLVMELVHKSREIQKEIIANYMKQQNKNKNKNDQINDSNNEKRKQTKISYPPLIMDDGMNCNDANTEDQVLSDAETKQDVDTDVDTDIDTEIKEEYVLGAIRPAHLREALRLLQADKSSFFHCKTHMFGAY